MKNLTLSLALLAYCSIAAAEVPSAYVRIANSKGVPPSVLWTIATVESNTKLNIGYYPWPWTLNVAGKPYFFPTRDEACNKALDAIAEHGGKSVDIGFTQNNWGYNGINYFTSPCDALDPTANLEAAADILRKCYDARKDWIEAAGCYHRPAGGAPAQKYKATFSKRWDGSTI